MTDVTKKMEYKVKTLEQQALPEILDLFKIAFQIDPIKEEYIWKYFQNPVGQAILIGIYKEEELAAFGAMIPEKMNVLGEENRLVHKYTDFMVHPNHRRKNLSRKIMDSLIERIQEEELILYGIGNATITKSVSRLNFEKVLEVYHYFKPNIFIKLHQLFTSKKELSKIEKSATIPNSLDNFSFALNTDIIEMTKSTALLRWRMKNPRFEYFCLTFKEKGEVLGYMIVGDNNYKLYNIIDFEAKNQDYRIVRAMLNFLEREVLKNSFKGIVVLANNDTYWSKVLRKNGFVVNTFKRGPLNTVHDLTTHKTNQKVLTPNNWKITTLQYDDI